MSTFMIDVPMIWLKQASLINPGVTITVHNFGYQQPDLVAQFING